VGGPAGVSDPDRARGQIRRGVADLADPPLEGDTRSVSDGDAPRIVAAILELLESAQDQVCRMGLTTDVAEDAAHGAPPARGWKRRRREQEGGTLSGLCRRVTTPVCSTHHDRARRGTIRRVVRSVPTSSSALSGGPGAHRMRRAVLLRGVSAHPPFGTWVEVEVRWLYISFGNRRAGARLAPK